MWLVLLLVVDATLASAVPLSSSVILFYASEYEQQQDGTSSCSLLVQRAAEQGSSAVNIVPTHYWMPKQGASRARPTMCERGAPGKRQTAAFFCHLQAWDQECSPFSKQDVQLFEQGFARCLADARARFKTVLISPHLDDGTKSCHWRNKLFFDPLKKDSHGFSYSDIMIMPILRAVQHVYAGAAGRGKQVWFGLQGEMGATVFAYPHSYSVLADSVRRAYTGQAELKLAILLNHASATGALNRLPVAAPLEGGLGPLKPLEQWPNHQELRSRMADIRRLFRHKIDIIGVSSYAPSAPAVRPEQLEFSIAKLDDELRMLGIHLGAWRNRPGKLFIMSEFGLGGGSASLPGAVATSASEAGRTPWVGVTTAFADAPKSPWDSSELQQFAVRYYAAALGLLRSGGIRYKVDGAFVWNLASFDVQGLHPASSGAGGSYAIPEVADAIRRHNQAGS